MNLKDFHAIIASEKGLDQSMIPSLGNLVTKYPFFQAGIFVYIKCLFVADSDIFSSELQRLSAFIHDRNALFYYVMDDIYKQFHHQSRNTLDDDRTNLLINAFFETQEDKGLDNYLEQTLNNSSAVSSDYLSLVEISSEVENIEEEEENIEDELELLDEETDQIALARSTVYRSSETIEEKKSTTTSLKHQDLIDNFLSKSGDLDNFRIKMDIPIELSTEEDDESQQLEEELDDDFFFTQTLANIYIKQKKYKRAYEIIKRLSLNYPEKNSYFADQLSFLEKAVKNLKK